MTDVEDFKNTLRLGSTNFNMKANLSISEPLSIAKWERENAYLTMTTKNRRIDEIKATNQDKQIIPPPFFLLHDGPPYANGHLHIGHALNKILKDLIIKHHYFRGEDIHYQPGWDCHGLPIEQIVEQQLKNTPLKNARDSKEGILEFRARCRAHALKFIDIQREEFREMGVIGDFNHPYLTLDFNFEAKIFEVLIALVKKGLLAQKYKPIYWSWACASALAEAEVEYKDRVSPSVFVSFFSKELDASFIIWTTTPWTLPANMAIALKPSETYVITSNKMIIAKKLYDKLKDKLKLGEITKEIISDELEHKQAINPLNNRSSLIILGNHVSLDEGTGAVHTAPGHGEDDFYISKSYNLDILVPVDDDGNFSDELRVEGLLKPEYLDEFIGSNVFKKQRRIVELLGDAVIYTEDITHSYPHCWRTREPIIYRATTQWFILMDEVFEDGKTLREVALQSLKSVDFYPKSGYKRLSSMLELRPDWCISRQRAWGVPLAFFYDKETKEPLLEVEVLEFILGIFKEEGCDAWWKYEIKDLLPLSFRHLADQLVKGKDILDVWFDSGSTWNAVLSEDVTHSTKYFPASMYLEGSDQHRGWFQSSLILSAALNLCAPFKSVLTHGFILDAEATKMSKSRGNVIAPKDVLRDFGGEILRLWVASSDYQSDLKISKDILKQSSEQYRKIRNTLRFLLLHTNELPHFNDLNNYAFDEISRWILNELRNLSIEHSKLCKNYEFAKANALLMRFISNELSGIYMDLIKDSLYCDSLTNPLRESIVISLSLILKKLSWLLAPTLTHTIDEVMSSSDIFISKDVFTLENVMLPSLEPTDFSALLNLRESFATHIDALKKSKEIKNTLELGIATSFRDYDLLKRWLIVSKAGMDVEGDSLASFTWEGQQVTLYQSRGFKCPRCWQYNSKAEGELCDRCALVLGRS